MRATLVPLGTRTAIVLRSRARHLAVVLVAVGLYLARRWQTMAGEPDRLAEVASGAAGLLAYTVPLVFAGVCRDLATGAAALWLQKPVQPVRFFLARFGETALVAVGLPLGLTACLATAAAIGDPEHAGFTFVGFPVVALCALSIISVGFGMSAWLPRVGGLATAAFLGLTFANEIQTALAMTSPEPPPVSWQQRLLLPLWAFRELGDSLTGASPFAAVSLVWPLAYTATWIGLGTLGVRYSVATGMGRPNSR